MLSGILSYNAAVGYTTLRMEAPETLGDWRHGDQMDEESSALSKTCQGHPFDVREDVVATEVGVRENLAHVLVHEDAHAQGIEQDVPTGPLRGNCGARREHKTWPAAGAGVPSKI